MKCPKCGYPRAKYEQSRKKYWSGKKGFTEPAKEPRTNFKAKCSKCGHTWNDVPEEIKSMEVEKNEVQTEQGRIETENEGTNKDNQLTT